MRVLRGRSGARLRIPRVGRGVRDQGDLVGNQAVSGERAGDGALELHDDLGGVGSCCTGGSNLVTAGFGEDSGDELVVVCTSSNGAGSGLEIVVGAGHKSGAIGQRQGDISGRNGDALVVLVDDHVGLQLVASGEARDVGVNGVVDLGANRGSGVVLDLLVNTSLGVLGVDVQIVVPDVLLGGVRHRDGDDEGLRADVACGGLGFGDDVGAEGEAIELGLAVGTGGLLDRGVNAVSLRSVNVAVVGHELFPAGLSGQVDVGQALDGELCASEGGAGDGGVLKAGAFGGAVGVVLHQLVDGDGAGLVDIQVNQRGELGSGCNDAECGCGRGCRSNTRNRSSASSNCDDGEEADASTGLKSCHLCSPVVRDL